ncbi:MAG: type VI secretion system membrane subunit TssM [Acetobacteraceae bacterium]
MASLKGSPAVGSLGLRWLLTALGAALLAALVWFFGPLAPPLRPTLVRAVIIAIIVIVWLIANLWIDARRRQKDAALEQGVTAGEVDPALAASAEEVAAVKEKLARALGILRKAQGRRGYLYEQPWYVIIGPPGAGKTTALLNSGLKFPLAQEMGEGALGGVGGTRLCEWWFTEEAVLIDTAGRYTTQDSDAAVDRAGWDSFLDLLKRTRTRQPLNGVLVAIAIPDIVGAEAERLAHARAIRKRIKEIMERLGVRVPVYALFTKADLLAGFTEFFDDLDREKRAQVWGTTFPTGRSAGEGGAAGRFREAFAGLMERLNGRLLERLQAERSPERRALIAGFPAQVASLGEPIESFLEAAFGGSRLDPAPFLRGAYFTSGTQEGTPIDRLTATLARAFGVDQRRVPSLKPERGRSYFLGHLLREVIFGEAMLGVADPAARRRDLLLRSGGFAAIAIIVIVFAALFVSSRAANQTAIAKSAAAIAAYDKVAQAARLSPVADSDLPQIAPLLDQARALPFGYAAQQAARGVPAVGGFGLSQSGKLAQAADLVYRHALERILLPRLLYRLETEMRGSLDRPDFLYQATRVYLMLGNQGPLDPALVHAWMALDWESQFPGPALAPVRADLLSHLDALLAEPLPDIPLDGPLVAAARIAFSRVPLAERVYSRIRPSAQAAAVAAWTPAAALGPAGQLLFRRSSGKPLTDGIAGFFTKEGFYSVLLPALGNVAKEVASESWVLGKNEAINPASPEVRSLEANVVRLYESDYERNWDAMLADLELAPGGFAALPQAVTTLSLLSSPQSPMLALLKSIAGELDLTAAPKTAAAAEKGGAAAAAEAAAKTKAGALGKGAAQLEGLFAKPGKPAAPLGEEVAQHYKPLIDYVGTGAAAPAAATLQLLAQVQQQLASLSQSATTPGSQPAALAGGDPEQLVAAEAARDPAPVSRWLSSIATSANVLRGVASGQQVKAGFNGPGGPGQFCQKAVNGRYPFFPGSTEDIPLGDFGRLFAPSGLLDTFFNAQVLPYVDTASATWQPKVLNGVEPPFSAGDVAEFQRASVIRNLFFAAGGTQPSVSFTITPVLLDDKTQQVTLSLGATTVSYAHGPPQPAAVTWPGPSGMDRVRLAFDPPPSGSTGVIEATGPWALFRLFGQGVLAQQGAPERFTLTFQVGGQSVTYGIRAASVFNPFSPGVLQAFRCPSVH